MTINIGAGLISKIRLAEQGSAPSTPAAGYGYLYQKADGKLYFLDDAGTEYDLTVNAAGDAGFVQGARVYNSTTQNVLDAAVTYLTFDTESYDTDGIHSTVSNTGRLTCQTAGKYIVGVNIGFSTNDTGNRRAFIHLNRTTVLADTTVDADVGGAGKPGISLVTVYDLSISDYVEIAVVQNSTATLTVTSGGIRESFWMHRIG